MMVKFILIKFNKNTKTTKSVKEHTKNLVEMKNVT